LLYKPAVKCNRSFCCQNAELENYVSWIKKNTKVYNRIQKNAPLPVNAIIRRLKPVEQFPTKFVRVQLYFYSLIFVRPAELNSTSKGRMDGNGELDGIWRENVVAYFNPLVRHESGGPGEDSGKLRSENRTRDQQNAKQLYMLLTHCAYMETIRYIGSELRIWKYLIYAASQWSGSASEIYLPSDRHLSAKLVPPFADRGCHVVSVTDLYCRILGFLDLFYLYGVIELKKSGAETNCCLSVFIVVRKQNNTTLHMLLFIMGVVYCEIRLRTK
jgi:hypothetical protein